MINHFSEYSEKIVEYSQIIDAPLLKTSLSAHMYMVSPQCPMRYDEPKVVSKICGAAW